MTLTALVQIAIYTCISNSPEDKRHPMNDDVPMLSAIPLTQIKDDEVLTSNMSILANTGEHTNYEWPLWLEPALLMSLLIILLHLLDRQIELTSRSDFLWRTKLCSEEEGGDTMLGINKVIR